MDERDAFGPRGIVVPTGAALMILIQEKNA